MIEIAKSAFDRTALNVNFYWLEQSVLVSSLHPFDLFANLRFDVDLIACADCLVLMSSISVDIDSILTNDGINGDEISQELERGLYLIKKAFELGSALAFPMHLTSCPDAGISRLYASCSRLGIMVTFLGYSPLLLAIYKYCTAFVRKSRPGIGEAR